MPALVSVIMPTFKRAALLPSAVQSVLDQTWRPLELIVVNDGSPDNTQKVLEELQPKVEAAGVKFKPVEKKNGGVSSARNEGLKQIQGEFVAFLDDDDLWYPEKTSRQLAAMDETLAGACCCLADCETPEGPATLPRKAASLLRGNSGAAFIEGNAYAWINSIIARTNAVKRVGEFARGMNHGEDDEWIARLCHEAEFCAVEAALCRWTFSPESLTRVQGVAELIKRDDEYRVMLRRIKESCMSRPGWAEHAWRFRVARDYDQFVKHRLYAGDVPGGREVLQEAESMVGSAPMARTRGKVRKAWLLSLIGMKLKHPRHENLDEIRK